MVRVVADRTLRYLILGIGRNGRIALRFVFRNRVRYSEGELNRENRNLHTVRTGFCSGSLDGRPNQLFPSTVVRYLFHFVPTFCHSLDRSEVGRRHA